MTIRPVLLAVVASLLSGGLDCRLQASQPAAAEPLSISDLIAYRESLEGQPPLEVRSVSFAELWEDAEALKGQWLGVEGVLRRMFRQEAVGSFPALTEGWLETPSGDLICVVFPAELDTPPIGRRVHFAGRYLRLVRYKAGDGARVTPCLVGPASPIGLDLERGETTGTPVEMIKEWHVGLALLVFVVLVLGAQHLRRRPALPRRDELSPEFWADAETDLAENSRDDEETVPDES